MDRENLNQMAKQILTIQCQTTLTEDQQNMLPIFKEIILLFLEKPVLYPHEVRMLNQIAEQIYIMELQTILNKNQLRKLKRISKQITTTLQQLKLKKKETPDIEKHRKLKFTILTKQQEELNEKIDEHRLKIKSIVATQEKLLQEKKSSLEDKVNKGILKKNDKICKDAICDMQLLKFSITIGKSTQRGIIATDVEKIVSNTVSSMASEYVKDITDEEMYNTLSHAIQRMSILKHLHKARDDMDIASIEYNEAKKRGDKVGMASSVKKYLAAAYREEKCNNFKPYDCEQIL